MGKEKKRRLKVGSKYRKLQYSRTLYPEIRLTGLWVQEADIRIGDVVEVECYDDHIRIKKQSQ